MSIGSDSPISPSDDFVVLPFQSQKNKGAHVILATTDSTSHSSEGEQIAKIITCYKKAFEEVSGLVLARPDLDQYVVCLPVLGLEADKINLDTNIIHSTIQAAEFLTHASSARVEFLADDKKSFEYYKNFISLLHDDSVRDRMSVVLNDPKHNQEIRKQGDYFIVEPSVKNLNKVLVQEKKAFRPLAKELNQDEFFKHLAGDDTLLDEAKENMDVIDELMEKLFKNYHLSEGDNQKTLKEINSVLHHSTKGFRDVSLHQKTRSESLKQQMNAGINAESLEKAHEALELKIKELKSRFTIIFDKLSKIVNATDKIIFSPEDGIEMKDIKFVSFRPDAEWDEDSPIDKFEINDDYGIADKKK